MTMHGVSPDRSNPTRLGVAHVVDSLAAGGTERVAVNLVNSMPRCDYRMHLVTTRCEGPLAELVRPDVGRLQLARRSRYDLGAIFRLARYVREQRIQIIHAHSSSLAIAVAASWFAPGSRVIWHDHFGRYAVEKRPAGLFRILVSQASGVVAVNEWLANWSRTELRKPAERVWYLPNFAVEGPLTATPNNLPGERELRIACLANVRPEKDHLTLVRAMRTVVDRVPGASLLAIGSLADEEQVKRVRAEIVQLGLERAVVLLGSRSDVPALLRACAVGVLSSSSEGLPLSLLEYGLAGLAAVATRIGQCPDVLDQGRCGLLVSPGEPAELAAALMKLLEDAETRRRMAATFSRHVREHYSAEAATRKLDAIYRFVLRLPAPVRNVAATDSAADQASSESTEAEPATPVG